MLTKIISFLAHKCHKSISPCPPHMARIEQEPKIWTGIMSTDNYNLIHISDLCLTISHVHAPNSVKRYNELRYPMPMSYSAPHTYWVLPASHMTLAIHFTMFHFIHLATSYWICMQVVFFLQLMGQWPSHWGFKERLRESSQQYQQNLDVRRRAQERIRWEMHTL